MSVFSYFYNINKTPKSFCRHMDYIYKRYGERFCKIKTNKIVFQES